MSSSFPEGYRQLEELRFRENIGFGYSDFVVGAVIEHRPGRTVTEMDNVLLTALTGNVAPIHLDHSYSKKTEWHRPLVCSLVTLSIVGGMSVRSTSGLTVGNLGWSDITLEAPVFVGDTLYAETEIIAKRLSQSRPQNGIITCRTSGFKDDGSRVIRYTRSFLTPVDATSVREDLGY